MNTEEDSEVLSSSPLSYDGQSNYELKKKTQSSGKDKEIRKGNRFGGQRIVMVRVPTV